MIYTNWMRRPCPICGEIFDVRLLGKRTIANQGDETYAKIKDYWKAKEPE